MNVRLTDEEAWDALSNARTGIFTTLRRDGVPLAIPVWFAVLNRRIYLSTLADAKKVARVRNDARCSFLIESGARWRELKAVAVTGEARVVQDPVLSARVREALDMKYAAVRTPRAEMPQRSQEHYAAERLLIEVTPDSRIISWDNAKLRD